jgi:dolichol-phosphate mannosyltransferase
MRQLIYKDLPEKVSDFRLISRPVADVMRQFSEHNRFYRGLVTWAGFRQTAVQFDRPARAGGETKWSPLKLIRLALDSIYSFSNFPLTVATWIGGASLIATVLLTVGSFVRPFGVETVSGFKTLLALHGLTFVCLGVLGQYVYRTYEEAKRRPLYIVNILINLEAAPGRLPSGGLIVSPAKEFAAPRESRKRKAA